MSASVERAARAVSAFPFEHVVLQPTTACNLNCCYCYLPDRLKSLRMPVEVAAAVASALRAVPHPVTVLWHGGEPLATGLDRFRVLVRQFSALRTEGKVRHSLQTNATLLTREWCEFLK